MTNDWNGMVKCLANSHINLFISYNYSFVKFGMQYNYIDVFNAFGKAISLAPMFQNICFKPKQIQCLEYLLNGFDTVAVLPTGTGYEKSLIFQILPWFSPPKKLMKIIL